jgi:peptide/nickel transport system substrate-binding protein
MKFIWLLILGIFAPLSGTPVMAQQTPGTTLRFIPHADLTILDPYWTAANITRNHGFMVYDTLFAMDSSFRPQPQMVETWQVSDDKLTYTFTLRNGLKFHDGQPVRANDVVASLKRWAQRSLSYGQALLAAATAIEPIDDSQFRILLTDALSCLRGTGDIEDACPVHHAGTAREDRSLHPNSGGDRLRPI